MARLVLYQDEKKEILNPEIFAQAEKVAAEIAQEGKVKSSQFRNYFAELRALENRFLKERKLDPVKAFRKLVPELELLRAKLAYNTRANGPLKGAKAFVGFLEEALDAGKAGPEEFLAMMKYVEAVLAYFYAKAR